MNSYKRYVCLIATLLLLTPALFAQASNLSILKGIVTDPSNAAIPGATITVTGGAGFVKAATSDADGKFSIAGVPAGKYTIRVSSTGFNLFEQANFDVQGGKQISLNAQLNIASEKQTITVTETVSIDLDPANNVGALVLKSEDLAMLSDNPDDLQNELQALAGPSAGPNGGQIFIDGFSGGKLPPKASIREIRVNSNPFSAEYDRIGFGRIEIFTKPGTDKFRGQMFYNAGNNVFNSRNPFAATKPDYSQNMFGGNISGPLGKKASFFLDTQIRRIDDVNTVNARVLDSSFNPATLVQNVANPTRFYDVAPRIDYQLSEKHTLTARYTFTHNESANNNVGQFTLPAVATSNGGHTNQLQLTHTWIASARLINEDRFQFVGTRSEQTGDSKTPTISVLDSFNGGGASLSLNYTNEKRYEYSNISSLTSKAHLIKFGGRIRGVVQDTQSTNGYNGTFTFTSLNNYAITQRGLAQGLSIADIIAQGGGAQQFTLTGGQPLVGVDQVDAGLFIQDDWRWKPNVTISTGLRFETQNNIASKFNLAPRIGVAWGLGKVKQGTPLKTVLRLGGGLFFDRFSEDLVLQARRLNNVVQQQYIVRNPTFFPNFPSADQLKTFQSTSTTRLIDGGLKIPTLAQFSAGLERALPKGFNLGLTYNFSTGLNQLRSRNINTPLLGTFNPLNPATAVYPYGPNAGNIYLYESTGRFRQNQLIVNVRGRIGTKVNLFSFYSYGRAKGNTDGAGSFPNNTYDLSTEWGRTSYDIRHRVFIGGGYSAPFKIQLSPFITASTGAPFNIVTGRDNYGDNQLNIHRPGFGTDPNAPGVRIYNGYILDPNPKPGQSIIPRNFGYGPEAFNVNLRVSRTWSFGGEPKGPAQDPMAAMMRGGGGPPGGGRGMGPMMGGGGGGRGGPMGGMFGDSGSGKYNLTFSISANNMLNRINYGRPIGTMTSSLFGQSNTIGNGFGGGPGGGGGGGDSANRRITLSLRFSF